MKNIINIISIMLIFSCSKEIPTKPIYNLGDKVKVVGFYKDCEGKVINTYYINGQGRNYLVRLYCINLEESIDLSYRESEILIVEKED